jgi:phage terminase small subunit
MAVAPKFLGHSPSMFIDTYVNTKNVTQSDL